MENTKNSLNLTPVYGILGTCFIAFNDTNPKYKPVKATDFTEELSKFSKMISKKYPSVDLIINTASSSTVFGSAVVSEYYGSCNTILMSTTKNLDKNSSSLGLYFKLNTKGLLSKIDNSDTILIVTDYGDSHFDTSLLISDLYKYYPIMETKKVILASMVDVFPTAYHCEELFKKHNIIREALYTITDDDINNMIFNINMQAELPISADTLADIDVNIEKIEIDAPNTRYGCNVTPYINSIDNVVSEIVSELQNSKFDCSNTLVIGTEECTTVATKLAAYIDKCVNNSADIQFTLIDKLMVEADNTGRHYPIKNGYEIQSFYRDYLSWIYNVDTDKKYDTIIILTDSKENDHIIDKATKDIAKVYNCSNIVLIQM